MTRRSEAEARSGLWERLPDVKTEQDRWERQRRSFESTAEAYDRYRPGYPDELFAALRDYADLAPDDDRILEIGCGTGRATVKVAEWGNSIIALEPAPSMADVARANLTSFANVEVRTTRFEDWDLEPSAFGLAFGAQSFHWLDPKTFYSRIAEALYAHGTIARIGNRQVVPLEHRAFFERVQAVYLEHAPEIAHRGEFRTDIDNTPLDELRDSGEFEDAQALRFAWHWTLDRDGYVGLLSTHSGHAALPDERRARLLEDIGVLIDDEFAGRVREDHVAELLVARKR